MIRHGLFAYGTLQIPEKLQSLLGRVPVMKPALLMDYRSGLISRADYPGIVSCAGAETPGQILEALSLAELRVLDRYEGELYQRIKVAVAIQQGTRKVWVYAIVPWARHRVTDSVWNLPDQQLFQRR